jgi:hypothetical protein
MKILTTIQELIELFRSRDIENLVVIVDNKIYIFRKVLAILYYVFSGSVQKKISTII